MTSKITARKIIPLAAIAALAPGAALAQEAAPASETTVFLLNSLLLIASGAGVFAIVAGLAMVETGLVRSKNAAASCLKKIAGLAAAILAYWLTGFHLFHGVEPGGLLGNFALWGPSDIDPVGAGAASSASFFYESALAALVVAIVSGALAERARLFAFVTFSVLLAGLIFPIVASWDWGGGHLETEWKFHDFAGASLINITGGAAALAGALIVGPRRGKYHGRRVTPLPGSNLPLAALGALIVWFGWFGLIAGASGSYSAIGDAIALATMIVNANMAAAGGVLAAIVMTAMIYKRVDLTIVLNAAIGGLVSLSADPLSPAAWQAALIGAMGGVIVTAGVPLLDRVRIDDPAGVVPAHLFCGLWGTLVVVWTNSEAQLAGQLIGILIIFAFAFGMSALVWTALRFSVGLRAGAEAELAGLDRSELGLEAYPDFRKG